MPEYSEAQVRKLLDQTDRECMNRGKVVDTLHDPKWVEWILVQQTVYIESMMASGEEAYIRDVHLGRKAAPDAA